MNPFRIGTAALALGCGSTCLANDACETAAIEAAASVSVSDGDAYRTRALFRSRHEAAIEFIDEGVTTIAVEGPFVWTRQQGKSALAGDAERQFAMGHQFHALYLHFDEIFDDVRPNEAIPFRGGTARGRSGASPGGSAHLIAGAGSRASGLKIEPRGRGAVEVEFSDWRGDGESALPWLVTIHDGDDVYEYRFDEISVSDRSHLWYHEETGRTGLDAVDIYRLHRQTLAAHCLGDAAMMARLSAPEGVVASDGDLIRSSRADLESMMAQLFETLDYTRYEDLADPIVEVSRGGDLGWIGVKVRAAGVAMDGGKPFSADWAWVLLARKIDGEWLSAGNASNRKPPAQ